MPDGGGWSTIESDEGVFTSLIENLGVKDVQFEELISLDADTIRSLSPVYGVIFLFKWASGQSRNSDVPQDGTYDREATDNGLFFAAQTIQNACGTQAVLSVILNQDSVLAGHPQQSQAGIGIDIGPELRAFKDFTTGFPPDLRGEALSNSALIRNSHNAFARASPFVDETSRPPVSEEDAELYHFIAYTPFNGVLYELDGLQPFPISHGPCEEGAFPEKAIEVLQRRIARYPEGEIRFNLMAVVRDLRVKAHEIGDVEMLEREKRKRRAWEWENALRRCNFVGFIGEVAKGVVEMKLKEGEDGYKKWVEGAKKETQRRLEMRRGRGGGDDFE
ncbi:ubiquitin carboxyl-terminal hydrolase [Histoplasma capsulatum G186AR]|uniref:Ubiquitin carboxyl-terminal hydrolase n=2 Tax=Ajellomyces capsulatus TaxID=5037 RepID=C0NEK7_AJECG|nr:ubiquitin carboxyl-terminal hydrolase [Histoplasma capsulatum G186AR]EEH09678.1 ubiquitin carboxyl-terminal hydrolase [Histoplasma capsulatum G186AR]KAG5288902.1 ubiquitin carboxyl-terminal hydrolase [Histoplasma capsulatum]QSS73305.1 ubiquitin carboxyl-terminal hydrolase [Histoplasma capsulatum G186AR]